MIKLENTAVHITNQDEWNKVLTYIRGSVEYNAFNNSASEQLMDCSNGCYSNKNWYKDNNYTIISFQEWLEKTNQVENNISSFKVGDILWSDCPNVNRKRYTDNPFNGHIGKLTDKKGVNACITKGGARIWCYPDGDYSTIRLATQEEMDYFNGIDSKPEESDWTMGNYKDKLKAYNYSTVEDLSLAICDDYMNFPMKVWDKMPGEINREKAQHLWDEWESEGGNSDTKESATEKELIKEDLLAYARENYPIGTVHRGYGSNDRFTTTEEVHWIDGNIYGGSRGCIYSSHKKHWANIISKPEATVSTHDNQIGMVKASKSWHMPPPSSGGIYGDLPDFLKVDSITALAKKRTKGKAKKRAKLKVLKDE